MSLFQKVALDDAAFIKVAKTFRYILNSRQEISTKVDKPEQAYMSLHTLVKY